MSIKNLYLPAQSGKIRMENGVYCGLKGVKSMIEVIYKEETDDTSYACFLAVTDTHSP